MNTQFSRRSVLAMATAGAVGVTALSACQSSHGQGGEAGGGTTTLDFWSYYEAAGRGSAFQSLADAYEEQSAVQINLNLAPQNFNTVLRTAMLSDDRPQFLGITQYNMRDFAQAGLLADVRPALEAAGIDDDIYPAAIDAGSVEDTLYGIADALRFGMWFYSPKGFDDLGVEPPSTYEELVVVAEKARAKDRYPILLGLKDLSPASNSLQAIIPAIVGLTAMLEASAAKDYTGQKFIDVLDLYRRMVDDGILDATDTGMAAADAEAMLVGGQAVMKPSASYDIGTLVALDPTISVFDEPVMLVDDPVVKYWGGAGQMYCVTADTPDEQAAMELLSWWVQPEQLGVQVEESGLVSSLQSANELIDPDSLAGFAAQRLDLVEEEGLFYNNYVPSAEAEAWGRAVQEVVSKAKSPEEAIETTVQAVFQNS